MAYRLRFPRRREYSHRSNEEELVDVHQSTKNSRVNESHRCRKSHCLFTTNKTRQSSIFISSNQQHISSQRSRSAKNFQKSIREFLELLEASGSNKAQCQLNADTKLHDKSKDSSKVTASLSHAQKKTAHIMLESLRHWTRQREKFSWMDVNCRQIFRDIIMPPSLKWAQRERAHATIVERQTQKLVYVVGFVCCVSVKRENCCMIIFSSFGQRARDNCTLSARAGEHGQEGEKEISR